MNAYWLVAIIYMILLGTATCVFYKRKNVDTSEPIVWVLSAFIVLVLSCMWPITTVGIFITSCIYFLNKRVNKWLDSRGKKDAS